MSPYPNCLVPSTAADLFSVGAPVDSIHFVLVTWEVHGQFPGANVPHFQRGVLGGGYE